MSVEILLNMLQNEITIKLLPLTISMYGSNIEQTGRQTYVRVLQIAGFLQKRAIQIKHIFNSYLARL